MAHSGLARQKALDLSRWPLLLIWNETKNRDILVGPLSNIFRYPNRDYHFDSV